MGERKKCHWTCHAAARESSQVACEGSGIARLDERFDLVQFRTALCRSEFAVVDVGDALCDRLLKKDVLLREGVIGVEKQSERIGHQFSIHQGLAWPSRPAISLRPVQRALERHPVARRAPLCGRRLAHAVFMEPQPVPPLPR